MKTTLQLLFAFAIMISMTACAGSDNKEAETGDAKDVKDTEGASAYDVNSDATTVKWIAHKFDGSTHYGTFPVKTGNIDVKGDEIVGGAFTFDIANMTVTDLEEGTEKHGKLVSHLQSDDFLNAENYPEGTFTITGVEAKEGEDGTTHEVTGNLKLRDKENSIMFPATVEMTDGKVMVEAKTAIDRNKWDIDFNKTNPAGEAIVGDNVDIEIELTAEQPAS